MRDNSKLINVELMQREILASHERSRQYGVSHDERSINQVLLSPEQLERRRRINKDFLDVASSHIKEFYEFLPPNDFMIAVVDHEGYILQMDGTPQLKAKFAKRNCAPGYRWTEKDVGTSATSLCLEKKMPVQLNDKDHYCRRAYGFTSSAAPVFGQDNELLGVLVVSGSSDLMHPHTLIMTVSAAHAVEKQLRVLRRNQDLAMNVSFLESVIEATGTGLIALNSQLRIWRINAKGKEILKMEKEDLQGMPISELCDLELDLDSICEQPALWVNRECFFRKKRRDVHFMYTAKPVLSRDKKVIGVVLAFEEIGSIRKLANTIAGTKAHFTFDHLIGRSASIQKAIDLARRASQTEVTVLLRGETGTGKELFAQAIHNGGPRQPFPFVPINCGAIPAELLESELFGYVEGAFTGAMKGGRPGKFELAHRGTLLLDEVGDMPYDMQVKLLRVLQTGEVYRIGARKPVLVNTRIIASTHVNLARAVSRNQFREDLFYRLNVFPIEIPPLRDRGVEDIKLLARFFLKRHKGRSAKITPAAMKALAVYHWPGNIRELENMIERALHLCECDLLDLAHLGIEAASQNGQQQLYAGTLEEMQRKMIATALKKTKSNMAATAKILGISRATLYRKAKQFRL